MKKILFVIALLLVPSIAKAQGTSYLMWDHATTTVAQAATMNTQVVADGVVITAPQTCTQVGTTAQCKVAIPALTNGPHTYKVGSTIASVFYEADLNITWPPSGGTGSGPTVPRLTITVIVNVP